MPPYKTTVVNKARVRHWRSGNHTPYPGMLHDPETDEKLDWQDLVLKLLWDLPEGARVSIDIRVDATENVAEDDIWVRLKPHEYGHLGRSRRDS